MLQDQERVERALVVKAILKGKEEEEDPLAEIMALTESAGGTVAGHLTQKIVRPNAATYLGKGKVEELKNLAGELDVDLVITDNDLNPAQERNLEELTGRKVVDRSQLIMDIFSQRARTAQAKLQVELAQLRYTVPRLKRMWTHLSRFEGGIGMRGPGETQLEEDKRIIERRIQKLEKALERIEERKETSLVHRQGEFVVSLVGYTNTGKSTLLNKLTGAREFVADKLFATLDTRVRRWHLESNSHVLLTDTVGFIRNLPHHLVASFHATLAETRYASLLLHVVDASSPGAAHQMQTVREVLKALECGEKETWCIFNKWDAIPPDRLVEARHLSSKLPGGERGFQVSALEGTGLEDLRSAVLERVRREAQELEILVPHSRSDVVAFVVEHGRVIEKEYSSGGVRLRAALTPARLGKLKALFPEGFRD